MAKHITRHREREREYVSGRISNEATAIVILFTFVATILNISISPRVPEWHEPDSEYIGHVVSNIVIKHWVDSNARSTPKSPFGCRTVGGMHSSLATCAGVSQDIYTN